MGLKKILKTEKLYEVIYEMCKKANFILPFDVYKKLQEAKIQDDIKAQILQNTYLANKKCRPLCQDSGQVVIFLDLGQEVILEGEYIEDVINKAVSDCYIQECYRKSVVKDALFDRTNTKTNTPCVIHTRITKGDKVKILLGLKGGGAENTSKLKMFNPTATKEEIFDFIKQTAKETNKNACPPMSLGIGVGGTIEEACLLAKRALYEGKECNLEIEDVFEIKMLTSKTHIACMPVCVNTNCHSARHKKALLKPLGDDFEVIFEDEAYEIKEVKIDNSAKEIFTHNIQKIKNLKKGDKISLTGTIYTARDQAHKRLCEMIEKNEQLPFSLKDIIIFYAGPCPKKEGEIIGPTGPTTAKRMDKFAPVLFDNGVLATIGKGERTINKGIYFTLTGGVASYIQECIKKCELTAFEDLGAEAVYKLEVEKLPVEVNYVN